MKNLFLQQILLCLSLMLIVGCNKGCFEAILSKKLGEEIRISKKIVQGELENGVKYYFMQNTQPKGSCFLRLNVSVGSFFESDDELGIAHTIEHLAFDDRAVSKDMGLVEWFQMHGMAFGPDANAFTTGENTLYQIDLPTCNAKDVSDGLVILRSFADGLQFREEAIAKEAKIIDAEEREYENTRGTLRKRVIEHMHSGTAYVSRPSIGKKAVRDKFTPEMIRKFYQKWYHPKNLSVVLVGDYGDLAPADMIKNAFASINAKADKPKPFALLKPDYKYPAFVLHEAEMHYVETVFSIQSKKITKAKFKKSLLKDRLAFDVALNMLRTTYATQTRLKSDQLRVPDINGFMLDNGVYNLTLSVPGTEDNFEQEFIDAFAILRRAVTIGFSKEDFVSAKNAHADSIEQWIKQESGFDSSYWANRIVGHINQEWYANDASDYKIWIQPILANLTAKDCQEALENAFKSGNHFIFAVGAIEESQKNITRMADLLKTARNLKLEKEKAPSDISFNYELPACKQKTKLIQEKIVSIDAIKVRLKNDWNVILKPTKFKTDEIILRLFTDEGYRTMTEDELTIGKVAIAVLPEGGLIKHPPEQIPTLIREKSLFIQLGLLWESIETNVFTRNKDVRFALEYLRAYISDPLYAETSLKRIKEEAKVYFAQLPHAMWEPLQHQFIRDLTGNDFRVGHRRLEDILKVNRNELLAWHQKFIRGKNINIVVVGDFDVASIINELDCVLGSLAKNTITPSKSLLPLKFKSGINKIYKVETKDATSKVVFRYPLDYPKEPRIDHRLALLKDIIQEILRLKFREKRKVIYTPMVHASDHQTPLIQNWLEIAISVPKSEAVNAQNDVKRILGKLSSKGITDEALNKAREPYAARMSKSLEENNFWSYALADQFRHGNLQWITSMSKDIKAVKTKDINELLRKYFMPKNASSAVITAIDG